MKSENTHKFGGSWTLEKLEFLQKYLKAYCTALNGKPSKSYSFNRYYIDAFAGTGECEVTINGEDVRATGSANIALATIPSFHHYFFIDKNKKHVKQLVQQAKKNDLDVSVIHGEGNEEVTSLISKINWRNTRAVMFLDPYGMGVKWTTLESIAKTKAIDLWYLFPIAAVLRQASNDFNKVDKSKEISLTDLFGTDAWKEVFYHNHGEGLFDNTKKLRRKLNREEIQNWTTSRFKDIFATVRGPALLGNKEKNVSLFALYCLSNNPSPPAIKLIDKFASHLIESHNKGNITGSAVKQKKVKTDDGKNSQLEMFDEGE